MIDLDRVSLWYGDLRAVHDLSFRAPADAITGFLGPNGAGKSTVLKMISTWLRPTAGRVTVAGYDVVREALAVRRVVGTLTEHNALYESMRVDRLLGFVAACHELSGARRRERLDWARTNLDLAPVWDRRVGECSKGFRRRVGLACAVLHDPPVLILDEPTEGLDPLQVVAFRKLLTALRPGRTIVLSSHVLAEVESVCDRVLVLHHGVLLADETMRTLRERSAQRGGRVEDEVLRIFEDRADVPA